MKMRAMGLRISCPLMGMGVGAGKGFESPPRPWGVLSFCSYPHITVEETEAHRGLITHSPKTTYMPHSGHSQDLTPPRSSWSQSLRVRQSEGESPCQSPGQLPQCPAPWPSPVVPLCGSLHSLYFQRHVTQSLCINTMMRKSNIY